METLHLSGEQWEPRARELAAEGWLLSDLCGLDRLGLGGDGARFVVVVQLLHHERRARLTVHVEADGDPPEVPSVTPVWPAAAFMEREAYDMFGIVFADHPKLERILMPEDWEGHPLRKDYGTGKVPVEFVPQPFLQVQAPGQSPRPGEAGVSPDRLGQGGPAVRRAGQPGGPA